MEEFTGSYKGVGSVNDNRLAENKRLFGQVVSESRIDALTHVALAQVNNDRELFRVERRFRSDQREKRARRGSLSSSFHY